MDWKQIRYVHMLSNLMDWKQIGHIMDKHKYYTLLHIPMMNSRIKYKLWLDPVSNNYFLTKGSTIYFTHSDLEVVIMYGVESEV